MKSTQNIITVKIKRGRVEVLARLYNGEPYPITYANRTQAKNLAAKMGSDWEVYWPTGSVFYVARV